MADYACAVCVYAPIGMQGNGGCHLFQCPLSCYAIVFCLACVLVVDTFVIPLIVKSSEPNSDGRVTYAFSVSGYTQTQTRYNGPVSKGMWYGTSVVAGSSADVGACVGYVPGVVGVM